MLQILVKNTEKGDFDKHLEFAAPECWSTYTTVKLAELKLQIRCTETNLRQNPIAFIHQISHLN